MIRKSIMFPRKISTINTIGPRDKVASLHAHPGIKNVIMGIRISLTRDETNFPDAPPIITAMASPMTPYFERARMDCRISYIFKGFIFLVYNYIITIIINKFLYNHAHGP